MTEPEPGPVRDPSAFTDVTRYRLPTWLLVSLAVDVVVLVVLYVVFVR